MSELKLFDNNALPEHLRNIELDDATKSLAGGSSPPRISIKGSVFRKVVNGEEVMRNEDRAMNVIIVRPAATEYRTFYDGAYKEGENRGPSCWSSDGVKPDESVATPQNSTCEGCPQNIKGSGAGEGRACRFSRWTAVALENDLDGDILQMIFPAQSIFGKGENGKLPLRQYAKFLAGHKLPVTAVVTEMRFDTNSATPKLTFKPVRPLNKEEFEKVKELGESSQAINAVTMTFRSPEPSDSSATEPFVQTQNESASEQTDEPAPKVKSKKTATQPADIQSTLDKWADD